MAGPDPEGWQRNVWALTLVVFVAFVGFQFFSPFLPLFVRELGVSDPRRIALWSGLLAATTPAISGVLAPWFGRLADRFGRKMMLIRSLAAFVVIIAAMGLVTSVEQFLVGRVLQGLFAGFTPMAMALASVSAPRERVPVAIGMVQSAQLLSSAIGPAAGGYVASHLGIRYAFFVTAGMCGLALIGLILLFHEARPERGSAAAPAAASPRRAELFARPHFAALFVLLMLGQFVDRGLALLVPLRVAALPGIEAAAVSGLIISAGAVAATLATNVVARLARSLPAGWLLLGGLVLGAPLCAAMALAGTWPGLLVLRVVAGLCLGGTITLAYALGGRIVPARERGAAFGWLAMGVQIGTAASPLATGALAAVSLPGAFVAIAALAGAGALVLGVGARGLLARHDPAEG